MPYSKRPFLSIVSIALFGVFLTTFTTAQAADPEKTFDPNHIIGDYEILDHDCMTREEIQKFLEDKNSYLANYSCENPDTGEELKASEIIYNRAINNKISPKFLLVLLQKEQSLIEDSSPSSGQLKWATGYGCPDSSGCNTRWEGFWKQVNSASLQFRDYMDNPHLYNFKQGHPYTFDNPYSTLKQEKTTVIPQNKATAALYNYTPHVYNGNYNFYRIWQRYFTKSYPDGSLLQAEGEAGVWLIDNGEKRPFHTQTALTSRFDKNKIITVSKSTLSSYPEGAPMKFPNYSLIRSPRGDIYLLVDDKKRKIANDEAFRSIGYNPAEIMNASWQDIRAYEDGKIITATSTYPTGALLQNNKTGGVYWVYEGTKAPVMDRIFLDTKFSHKHIIQVEPEKLEKFEKTDAVRFDNGELITTPDSPAVYLISDNKLRPFISGEAFEDMGYKWKNIITTPSKILGLYEKGEYITKQGS
jgi:hypothetical protein